MQANQSHSIVAEGQQIFAELLKTPNLKIQDLRERLLKKVELWKEKALNFMPKGVGRRVQRQLSTLFTKFENFIFKAGKTRRSTGRGACKVSISQRLSDGYERSKIFFSNLSDDELAYTNQYLGLV